MEVGELVEDTIIWGPTYAVSGLPVPAGYRGIIWPAQYLQKLTPDESIREEETEGVEA